MIRDLFVDAAGVLWVATAGGASRFEGAAWLTYSKLDLLPSGMLVNAALRDLSPAARGDSIDGDGIVWIGGAGTNVSPIQNLKLSRRANGRLSSIGTAEGLTAGALYAIAPADSGAIWCGTATLGSGGGVARVSAAGVVTNAYAAPGAFPSSRVFALADAGGGVAWAATQEGAVRVDRAGHATLPIRPGAMPDAPLVGVAVDAAGRAWFASGAPLIGNDPRAAAGAVRFDPADSSYLVVDVAAGLPTNNLQRRGGRARRRGVVRRPGRRDALVRRRDPHVHDRRRPAGERRDARSRRRPTGASGPPPWRGWRPSTARSGRRGTWATDSPARR